MENGAPKRHLCWGFGPLHIDPALELTEPAPASTGFAYPCVSNSSHWEAIDTDGVPGGGPYWLVAEGSRMAERIFAPGGRSAASGRDPSGGSSHRTRRMGRALKRSPWARRHQ